MAEYEVVTKPSVEKDLRHLPTGTVRRVLAVIGGLGNAPRPRLVQKIAGAERQYRVRVGNYRIVYEIDDAARIVTVYYVRHRSVAYRSL